MENYKIFIGIFLFIISILIMWSFIYGATHEKQAKQKKENKL